MDKFQNLNKIIAFHNYLKNNHDYISFIYKKIDLIDCLIENIQINSLEKVNRSKAKNILFTIRSFITSILKVLLIKTNEFKSACISHTSILFYPFIKSHIDFQIPIYNQLIKNKIDFAIITHNFDVYSELKSLGYSVSFRNVKSFSFKSLFFENKVNSFLLHQKNAMSDVNKNILNSIRNTFNLYSKVIFNFIDDYIDIIYVLKPKVLIISNDISWFGRTFNLVAKQNNIKSICINHGSLSGEPLDSLHISTYHFVFGEINKMHLEKYINPKNILITGSTILDNFLPQTNQIHSLIANFISSYNKKKYILFAHSGPGHCTSFDHFYAIVRAIMRSSIDLNDYLFIIKLHPKDSLKNYINPSNAVPNHRCLIIEHGNLEFPSSFFDWLQGCNLLITGSSASAHDAMLMNVPVLTIDLFNEYTNVDFIDIGATIHITKEANLTTTIKEILESNLLYSRNFKNACNYIKDYYLCDGKASKRCMDNILKIM